MLFLAYCSIFKSKPFKCVNPQQSIISLISLLTAYAAVRWLSGWRGCWVTLSHLPPSLCFSCRFYFQLRSLWKRSWIWRRWSRQLTGPGQPGWGRGLWRTRSGQFDNTSHRLRDQQPQPYCHCYWSVPPVTWRFLRLYYCWSVIFTQINTFSISYYIM